MKINLTELSDKDLAGLIRRAMEEWERRQEPEVRTVIERRKPVTHVVVINEPPEEDKDFVLQIKQRMLAGQYIKAHERREIERIAQQHETWVRRQKMPTCSGTGDWREAAERIRMGQATEL